MKSTTPNIVIVVADDITPLYHGCYGGPTPTPNIDRLAREGVLMERGYCNASLCCPSRYTLFTGQVPQRSLAAHETVPADQPALISQNGILDQNTPTLAKELQKAGYHTGHIGKWHSGFDSSYFGFDEPKVCEGDPDDPAVETELRHRQAQAQEVVKRYGGFDYADRVNWGDINHRLHPKIAKHNIGWLTDGALAYLDLATQTGKPFYLHLANSVPHAPDCQDSLNADHTYTWGGRLSEPPKSHPSDDTVLERMRRAGLQIEGGMAGVNTGAIQIDDQIGALVNRLEALGQLDNTIFIYTADHGIPGKGSCHLTGMHLPFVMRWPQGLPQGRRETGIYSWVDTVPTLCEACGITMPAGHTLDGVSVLAALRGDVPWPRQNHYHEMGWSRSLTRGRYHYIATRYPDKAIAAMKRGEQSPGIGLQFDSLNAPSIPAYLEPEQLYDNQLDPFHQHNLAAEPSRQSLIAELRQELQDICAAMPRPFPREPHEFLKTTEYTHLLAKRQAEMAAIQHHPPGFAPRYWFCNLADPTLENGVTDKGVQQ